MGIPGHCRPATEPRSAFNLRGWATWKEEQELGLDKLWGLSVQILVLCHTAARGAAQGIVQIRGDRVSCWRFRNVVMTEIVQLSNIRA